MKIRCKCTEANPKGDPASPEGVDVKMIPVGDDVAPASFRFRLTDAAEVATIEVGAEYDVDMAWTKAEAPAEENKAEPAT